MRDSERDLGRLVEPIFTSLPRDAEDGQVINFLADATNGVVWRLRYRAASTSVYKWEYVGGVPLLSRDTNVVTVVGTVTPIAGVTIVVPRAGDYHVTFGSLIACTVVSAGNYAAMNIAIGAAAVDANNEVATSTTNYSAAVTTVRITALAGDSVVAVHRTDSGTGSFIRRFISITPVRVG